jgi:hypothetical protein
MRRKPHILFGCFRGYPADFKHYPATSYYRYPFFRSTFTSTLTGFSRFLGNGFVRENPYPNLTAAADITGDCPACSLYLAGGNPAGLKRLQSKFTESNCVAFMGSPVTTPALYLPKLNTLGLEHIIPLPWLCSQLF